MLSFYIYKIISWKIPLEEMLNAADAVGTDNLFGGGLIRIQGISLRV